MNADLLVEIEHAEALHYEDASAAALDLAALELRAGKNQPTLSGEDDGCYLPGRGYRFLACGYDGAGAVQIAVTPADGGVFVATLTTRYTHVLGDWDEQSEETADHFTSEEAAVKAALARSWRHTSETIVVYDIALYSYVVAVVRYGTVYRPTTE